MEEKPFKYETAFEADKAFPNAFRRGEPDIRPESLIDSIGHFDSAIKAKSVCEYTEGKIHTIVQDLIKSYNSVLGYALEVGINPIGPELSKLMIANTHIYDEEMCNFVTDDMDNESKSPITSRFTFVAKKALDLYNKQWKETEQEDGTHRISPMLSEDITSLFNTVIDLFDPQVVANVLATVISANRDSEYLTRSRITGYFEALRNRENALYQNKVVKLEDTVVWAYAINALNITPEELVFNEYHITEFIEGSTLPVSKTIKSEFSSTIINYLIKNPSSEKAAALLIKMRDELTKWIKTPVLDERPASPSFYNNIDVFKFNTLLYNNMIHVLGDADAILGKFDDEIEKIELQLDDLDDIKAANGEDDSLKEKYSTLNAKKTALINQREKYTTIKSAVDFYFLEISSNEKLAVQSLSREFIVELLIKEPPLSFGMSHVHYCIAAMFTKRDFTPMSTKSVNPYYVHYSEVFPKDEHDKEGITEPEDISTLSAFYIASAIAANVHAGMRSITACSGAFNIRNLEITVDSLTDSVERAREIASNIIIGHGKRVSGLVKQYASLSNDDINSLAAKMFELSSNPEVFGVKNINDLTDTITALDKELGKLTDKGYELSVSVSSSLKDLTGVIGWYKGYINSAINIMGQVNYIVDNLDTNSDCASSAGDLDHDGKPMLNLWPITTQWQYEIEEKIAPVAQKEGLKPGDVKLHRYGSRYELSKVCD